MLAEKASWSSGFGSLSYTRPEQEALEGSGGFAELRRWLRNGLDLGGGKDSLGFLFLCARFVPAFLSSLRVCVDVCL